MDFRTLINKLDSFNTEAKKEPERMQFSDAINHVKDITFTPPTPKQNEFSIANNVAFRGKDLTDPNVRLALFQDELKRSPGRLLGEIAQRIKPTSDSQIELSMFVGEISEKEKGNMSKEEQTLAIAVIKQAIRSMDVERDADQSTYKDSDEPDASEMESTNSNTEALKMNKYGDMEGMPEPDESMFDLGQSMMQPKLADALAKAAGVNRKDVYFDDADLVWGSKTVVHGCLADKECTFQHAVDELKKFANSNPKAESTNEAEKRWKQTSMSPEEAIKKYGKEHVKVKKGALRNGDDMVEVHVESMSEAEEKDFDFSKDNLELCDTCDKPIDKCECKGHDHSDKTTKEAVGDFAKPIYDLLDQLGDNAEAKLLDDLIRYLDADVIKDFVDEFRSNHDYGKGIEYESSNNAEVDEWFKGQTDVSFNGNDFYEAFGWVEENDENVVEAEYQGRTVKLNKPMRGDVKKFKVYVTNPKGNVVKVNFGDPDMRIKKSNPARRRSFRARHNCDNPGPKTKARYWSCRKW
jgi:hypothetical protein|tara:strand:+ start:1737 stop:3302 length:1566 start_codon:yes stop_codon:yes gene_type:complete